MGDSGAALEGLIKVFSTPEAYDVLPYRHNYTSDGLSAITGYFIPAYSIIADPEYLDSRGWTDPDKGKEFYLSLRVKKASDPKALLIECAEYCFTPEEAFALEGENTFDTALLADLLMQIKVYKTAPHIEVGNLEYTFKGGVHKEENIDKVIFKKDPRGKILILEEPILGVDGLVPKDLYVAGIDGIDLGQEDTSVNTTDPSLFCVVVLRRTFGIREPLFVCLYKDRPNTIKEAHLICLKILLYYNCLAVLEATRISTLTFFRLLHCENKYLMRRPRATQADSERGNSRKFGAPASEVVIRHQLELIAEHITEYSFNMWFLDMLEEMIRYSYTNKRKFDIVAAVGMCLLGEEELVNVTPRELDESSKVFPMIGYWKDEDGIMHRGAIPTSNNLSNRMIYGFNEEFTGIRTSSRRFDPEYL